MKTGEPDEANRDLETENEQQEQQGKTNRKSENKKSNKKEKEEPEPFDVGIMLIDSAGRAYRTRLGDYVAVQPPLKPEVFKSRLFWDDPESEVIQQYVLISLESFRSDTGERPPAEEVRIIKFVFDHPKSGTLILDQIGFTGSEVP